MLMGISQSVNPNKKQRSTINRWMGCSNFIWNAKYDEDRYLTAYAKCYLPIGVYPKIDQSYSQYKDPILSPWLKDCPSQILRNSVVNWYKTYKNFLKGLCKKPRRKRKSGIGSIHLTKELFCFEKCNDGVIRLFIGTKRNNIGYLSIKSRVSCKTPNSIYLKRQNGKYWISFCYEDSVDEENLLSLEDHLESLKEYKKEDLEKITIGIDRGIKRPVQAGGKYFDFSKEQIKKKRGLEKYIKRCQRSLSKKLKGSKRKYKKKQKLSKKHKKIANIRKDFCHKTSRSIVDDKEIQIIVLEDLKTIQMTKKAQAKKDVITNKWVPNGRKSKSALNRSILDKGWHLLETFLRYKSYRANKALFKVLAYCTSQECADCGHTHPSNRIRQNLFICASCGHTDHADRNAAEVIKKRAINLILHSGTELSKRGVLLDIGRGATNKTRRARAKRANSYETSKKKGKAYIA